MHPARTRIASIGITGAAFALALATAGPAWADPGNGNGNGGSNGNAPSTPPGQAKQASPTPTASPATNPAPTPTATHVPPGQAKKSASPKPNHGKPASTGNSHGRGKGNANAGNNNGGGKGKGANGPSGHNPPGNNGTVKIHSVAGDTGHHNVPHPGCSFVVDFWGFDAGQTLNVSFTGQAPTGAGTPLSLSGSGTSITSPDDAGGGNDPDGELVFTPTAAELSVLGAPAKQGYHVRLTVATGQGGGQKQKVFWISPCASGAPETSVPPTPTDTPTLDTDTPTLHTLSNSMNAAPNVPVASLPVLNTKHVSTSPRQVSQAAPPLASLPFTGADVSDLIAGGVMALMCGVVLTIAARRQRRKIG